MARCFHHTEFESLTKLLDVLRIGYKSVIIIVTIHPEAFMSQICEITEELRTKMPDLQIKQQEPMKLHTSFRVGGPCDLLVQPRSVSELRDVLLLLQEHAVRPVILGAGTNVLVSDEGIRGVVLSTKLISAIEQTGETILTACCGAQMSRLAGVAMERGLTGLEFAQGIPGTVGGGVFMNAGAYDGEIKNVAARTTVLTLDGTLRDYAGEAQGFRYRGSAFQNMDGIIVQTEFRLTRGNQEAIRRKMQDFAQRRRSKQPLELPSAGSTFKRPAGYYAGALIQEAGLKGFRIGGAAVSEKHAGFVVNLGDATAQDVKAVIEAVQKRVYENSGVMLEPEVRLI